MNREKFYRASQSGNVLLLRAAIGNSGGGDVGKVSLLVDTGSSYTILPVEV